MKTGRRRTLRALGATVAVLSLAGCGANDPDASDGTPDVDGTPTDGSGGVTVRDVAVRPELLAIDDDAYLVVGGADEAFVLADVAVDPGVDDPPTEFAVKTPSAGYEAVEVGDGYGPIVGFGDRFAPADGGGWVAVRVPRPLEAGSAALTWDGGRHAFEDAHVERLNRAPASFDATLDAPAAATVGETVTATVTVENVADADGTFVGALNRSGPAVAYAPAAAVVLEVPAGGTETWTFTHTIEDPDTADGVPPMRLFLVWRDGDASREVRIERA